MKKITALLLAVLCMLSVCACNNDGDKTADVSAKDLIAATLNSEKPENADTLCGSDDQSLKNKFYYFYGIETSAVRDYAIVYSSAAKSDEISVLVAAKGTDMKTLTNALEGRREMQRQTFELYSPESVEMLKNAVIFTQGDYAVMIVAKDPTAIESRIKELLKDAKAVGKESKAYYDTAAVEPTPTPKPSYDYSKPVPQAGAKDNSWFRDAAFVGDSRMEGVMNYADFEYASNFSHVGLNVADVFTKPYIETESGSVTVADALHNDLKYGKVYVMLGINELGWYNLDKFVEYYGNIVDLLRETHPEAEIYIISILPVGAKAAKSSDMLNNDRVRMFNERIQGMCADKQVYFVNGFEALASNGSLPDDASPDGIHMQPSYCHKLTDYLLTHTVSK